MKHVGGTVLVLSETIDDISQDNCHKRHGSSVCNCTNGPGNHEEEISRICKREELEEGDPVAFGIIIVISALRLLCPNSTSTTHHLVVKVDQVSLAFGTHFFSIRKSINRKLTARDMVWSGVMGGC